MIGIWFNHEDYRLRSRKHIDFSVLKLAGITDAYILIKGMDDDVRITEDLFMHTKFLFSEMKKLGIRTHGTFMCSHDKYYCKKYPDRADDTLFGHKSDYRISHVDPYYLEYLENAIFTANDIFEMDGIQLDFLRYGIVSNGWSKEEEQIYEDHGLRVPEFKKELIETYDSDKPEYNLSPIVSRYDEGDDGFCFFRYGRVIFAVKEDNDTILFNSYPGSVKNLILIKSDKQEEKRCEIEEGRWFRIKGHYDIIRAFGSFKTSKSSMYEGELCVVRSSIIY